MGLPNDQGKPAAAGWPRRGFARLGDAGTSGSFPVKCHSGSLLLLCHPDTQSSVWATPPDLPCLEQQGVV